MSEAVTDGCVDMLVMGGFSTNDAAKRNDGVKLLGFEGKLSTAGDFPGAWNPEHFDLSGGHQIARKCLLSTLE